MRISTGRSCRIDSAGYALDRMPRSLWAYEDIARVHLSLSGTLLETLADPAFQQRAYGVVKCGDLLWHLQNERISRARHRLLTTRCCR